MITSIATVTQVSIKFRDKKKENIKKRTNIEHITKHTHEHDDKYIRNGRGGNCVGMYRYTYATTRIRIMRIKTGDRHRRRVMRTSRTP